MFELKNNLLKIQVKKIGAELCGITSIKKNTEFMWNANPDVWGSYAPNLFPIIGAMKDDSYIYNSQKYNMPKHGFLRHSEHFNCILQTENQLVFKHTENQNTLKHYPFTFEFYIKYTLKDTALHIEYEVINTNNKDIYFSIGGHPAFKCPVYKNENYTDYKLIFDQDETLESSVLNMKNGLITDKTIPAFDDKNCINLHYNLFSADALIFKTLKSRAVILHSKNHGDILTVNFPDFPSLGIWAKPNADYVCIEPWIGHADNEDTNQEITAKQGIITLVSNSNYKATYSIKIHKNHMI